MKKNSNLMCVLIAGLFFLVSCTNEEEIIPRNDLSLDAVSKTNGHPMGAIKFEAVHAMPIPPGGTMPTVPPPEITPANGNRYHLTAPVMSMFTSVTPISAAEKLMGGMIMSTLEAFWKFPSPEQWLLGTGPAKGEFTIIREGQPIWIGTITGVRKNCGVNEQGQPLFQWKGQIKANGTGAYEGLKLTATETTDPSPFPAMTYFWRGVITP